MSDCKNWVATVYNDEEEVIARFLVKDRTEHQAFKEVEKPVSQVDGYDDWSLMPEDFWKPEELEGIIEL